MRHVPATLLYSVRRAYWWCTRPVTVGVKALLMNPKDGVLLVRHTYQPGWHIPGGKLDRGETLAQAAARELREEVGMSAAIRPHDLVGIFSNFADFKHDHVALFRIDEWSPAELRVDGWEIAEAAFFPLDALPSDTTIATRKRIEEVLGTRTIDYVW